MPDTVKERANSLKISFAKRLAQVIAGQSISGFSMKSGVSESLLRKYLAGDSLPGTDKLVSIARAADADIDWLASGDSPAVSRNAADNGDRRYCVPPNIYEKLASIDVAHNGGPARGPTLAFCTDWVENNLGLKPEDIATFVVDGDAMAPNIDSGHTLLVDTTQTRMADDSLYVINRLGTPVIKRLQKALDGSVHVRSDNPAYQPEQLNPKQVQSLEILGKVVWIGGRL